MSSVEIRSSPAPVAAPAALALTRLAYELLDALLDTEQLMGEPSTHLVWTAHMHYLRDLQRVARVTLARVGA